MGYFPVLFCFYTLKAECDTIYLTVDLRQPTHLQNKKEINLLTQ